MIFDNEEFRDIPGAPGYFISSDGRVLSSLQRHPRLRILDKAANGYFRIALCVNWSVEQRTEKHPVHRLVALAWIGPPPDGRDQINHKNGCKTDNRVENLEWCSHAENQRHWCDDLKKRRVGRELSWTKLTPGKVLEIRRLYSKTNSSYYLGRRFGVSRTTIMSIIKRKIWTHVPQEQACE